MSKLNVCGRGRNRKATEKKLGASLASPAPRGGMKSVGA